MTDTEQQRVLAGLPQSIRDMMEAKASAAPILLTAEERAELEARAAELERITGVLERDIAEVEAENRRFRAMKPLFDKGGFEAVVAAKDEEARVLETRVYSENYDKDRYRRSARYWEREARRLGYVEPAKTGAAS